MSPRTIGLNDQLHGYLISMHPPEDPVLARLRQTTEALGDIARMQIGPEQGQFMQLLVRTIDARKILEVGTFTGYSSLAMTLAMPAEGRLVTCDISETFTSHAQRAWREAGVESKVKLVLGPARESLDAMIAKGEEQSFDLAFIDADKGGYDAYFERSLRLVRRGGLIVIDNVLWGGRVADPAQQDEDTRAIRDLNQKLRNDPRVTMAMLAIGDGLTVARVT